MSNLVATANATRVVFSDVNPDVGVENTFPLVYNEDAINKSIVTILGTRRFTRPFRRQFGSYVIGLLFDPLDDRTASAIRSEIIDAIRKWEPRVVLSSTTVLPDYAQQAYYVSIEYTIPALMNKSATFSFNMSTRK